MVGKEDSVQSKKMHSEKDFSEPVEPEPSPDSGHLGSRERLIRQTEN